MTSLDRFTASVREEREAELLACKLRSVMRELALAALSLEDPPEDPITFLIRPYQD